MYVELTFDNFDVGQNFCFNDIYMAIRDGLGNSSSILATLCDKREKFAIPVRSSANAMSVEIIGRWKATGFKASYQAHHLADGGENTTLYYS